MNKNTIIKIEVDSNTYPFVKRSGKFVVIRFMVDQAERSVWLRPENSAALADALTLPYDSRNGAFNVERGVDASFVRFSGGLHDRTYRISNQQAAGISNRLRAAIREGDNDQ